MSTEYLLHHKKQKHCFFGADNFNQLLKQVVVRPAQHCCRGSCLANASRTTVTELGFHNHDFQWHHRIFDHPNTRTYALVVPSSLPIVSRVACFSQAVKV